MRSFSVLSDHVELPRKWHDRYVDRVIWVAVPQAREVLDLEVERFTKKGFMVGGFFSEED
jgi:hypothetical protein